MSIASSAVTATAAPSQAALPNDLPSLIYLPAGPPGDPGSGWVLITLLLDSAIPWKQVTSNGDSAIQLFAWFPIIISNALDIDRKSGFFLGVMIREFMLMCF